MEAVSSQDDKWDFLKTVQKHERNQTPKLRKIYEFFCLFQGRKEKEINEELSPV